MVSSDLPAAAYARTPDRPGGVLALLARLPWLGPLLGLLVTYGLFALFADPDSGFATLANLRLMARQTAVVGTAALGMTLIIILGGIDLSVGSLVALVSVVVAYLLQAWDLGPLAAAAAGVAVGLVAGLINALLIVGLRVTPFIITLGAMGILRGLAKGLAGEQKIDAPTTWLKDVMADLDPAHAWMLFPPGVWLMVLLAALVAALLHYTRLGRHIYAVGSSEPTARLCGLSVGRVKLTVYGLAGALAGLAGVLMFSRLTVGDPTTAVGLELEVIAAVVIGGGSLLGGVGSIAGSLIGAALMTVIRSGCSDRGIANWQQEILTGLIIVAAVALDRLRQRRRAG